MIKNGKWINEKKLEGFRVDMKDVVLKYTDVHGSYGEINGTGVSICKGVVLTHTLYPDQNITGFTSEFGYNYIIELLIRDCKGLSEQLRSCVHDLDEIVDLDRLRKCAVPDPINFKCPIGTIHFKTVINGAVLDVLECKYTCYVESEELCFLDKVLNESDSIQGYLSERLADCFNWDLINDTLTKPVPENPLTQPNKNPEPQPCEEPQCEKVNDWEDWGVGDTVECLGNGHNSSNYHSGGKYTIKGFCEGCDTLPFLMTSDIGCVVRPFLSMGTEFIRVMKVDHTSPPEPAPITCTTQYSNLEELYSSSSTDDPYNIAMREAYESLRHDIDFEHVTGKTLFNICNKLIKV